MYINKSGAKMQKRLSMVAERMKTKREKMKIGAPYAIQELTNLDIVLVAVI
jgi:hypothetical protein